RLRRHHQQHEAILRSAGDADHVRVHRAEPADVNAATVDGNSTRSTVPGVQVERHPSDHPQ
ncbi:MAG TPA: hypothetical protein VFA45_04290, partial [Actinomycetes bacterium]|nr:hypothetical protein [Actinomycetes bacterium]